MSCGRRSRRKQTTLNAYNAVKAQQTTNQQNDMVNNAVVLTFGLAFLLAVIALLVYVLQHRRAPVVYAPPAPPAEDVIEAEYNEGDAP